MQLLERLKNKWIAESTKVSTLANDEDILIFQKNNNVILPADLILYFKKLNGSGGECLDDLYEFYSISRIRNVINEYSDWDGIPEYKKIPIYLNHAEQVYVFANYFSNLFAYGIRLSGEKSIDNEVFVICGEEYKKIANSFSEFIELYLSDSIELQFNK